MYTLLTAVMDGLVVLLVEVHQGSAGVDYNRSIIAAQKRVVCSVLVNIDVVQEVSEKQHVLTIILKLTPTYDKAG